MAALVLRLDKSGFPMTWIGLEEAACFYAKNMVLWSIGTNSTRLHGGINRISGAQSLIDIAPVIAVDGELHQQVQRVPKLTSSALFARDKYHCMYCGETFAKTQLTRDHVLPKGLGGKDTWTNCVSACKPCNHRKACKTPEQAAMPLLAIPYQPNKFEYMALANRNILADQMDYLAKGFVRFQA
ncbi:MAG: HNH endonuclease [Gammaproteobacteria bacterium]|nr:HNH endonuclease [Gammaproteobacteria bacterium]NVK87840.1 HNH endonuclease [Gammaproteobacteria bacterium]